VPRQILTQKVDHVDLSWGLSAFMTVGYGKGKYIFSKYGVE